MKRLFMSPLFIKRTILKRVFSACLFTACLCVLSFPTQACTPPPFPVPDNIQTLQVADRGGEPLTAAEQALLDSYRSDRTRYFALFETVYPCHMNQIQEDENNVSGPARENGAAEMHRLEDKWAAARSSAGGGASVYDVRNQSGAGYDVPAENLMIHFE